jgi:ferric-dicitrate binding protein FerR (iron transport regulator)
VPTSNTPSKIFQSKWLYLAVVVILSATTIAAWYYRQGHNKPVLHQLRDKQQGYTTYTGIAGERKKITLPDNTTVILNGNTRLMVPDSFMRQHAVLLDGEAYFDAPGPLIVKTNILIMTTQPAAAFKIRCFELQQGATAYLVSGKVQVTKSYLSTTDNQPEILGNGNMILANKEIDLMEKETYVPLEMKEWLEEKMSFEKEPFMNVMHKLEDWYGTEIYVDGNTAELALVTASFDHATLSQALDDLRKQAKFTYKISNEKVNITF